jgi:glycosyltransferase involved in cell wall biosynthesis
MTRVLLDARVSAGGVGRYSRDLSSGLRSLHDVDPVVVEAPHSTVARFGAMPFTPWGRSLVAVTAAKQDVDLIHGLHLELPDSSLPMVVTVHDLIPLQHPGSMPQRWRQGTYRSILKNSLHRARRVIVPSQSTQRALEDQGFGGAVEVIPHGVSDLFRPLEPQEKAKARARFGSGRAYVSAIASPKAHKNSSVSLETGRLLEASTGVPVVHIGEGPRGARVDALGTLSDAELRLFFGGAEAFLCTSLTEGFGLPSLEALACGTPVLCGSGLGALPFLGDGVRVGDVTDPVALAASLQAFLEDGAQRDAACRSGLEAARSLTIEAMCARTAAVYRELVDG